MFDKKKVLGKKGEDLAAGFLEANGYQILERNWRCPFGEIDIVAKEGEQFVFVEVKTKQNLDFGRPEEMVTFKKQQKLVKLAQAYLGEKNLWAADFRIDVVAIDFEVGQKINLIKNVILK